MPFGRHTRVDPGNVVFDGDLGSHTRREDWWVSLQRCQIAKLLWPLNAVNGAERTGCESVVGPFGQGTTSELSWALLLSCCLALVSPCLAYGTDTRIFTDVPGYQMTAKHGKKLTTSSQMTAVCTWGSIGMWNFWQTPNTDYLLPCSTHEPLDVSAILRERYNIEIGSAFSTITPLADSANMPGNWNMTPYSQYIFCCLPTKIKEAQVAMT